MLTEPLDIGCRTIKRGFIEAVATDGDPDCAEGAG